ncbi:MAG: DUF5074 domain-containing protein [Chryseolinea sp.]
MKLKLNFLRKFTVSAVIASMIFIQSCTNDPEPLKPGESGFFIVNEGAFNGSNTSLSFYDRKADAVTNNIIFTLAHPLGDQSQSMSVFESKGYIVVQNSSKIEVIDVNNFTSLTTITEGLPSPRYFLGISSTKAYVSDWGSNGVTGTVKVIDLTTNEVTKTISTGVGTNRMLQVGNLVYVTNAGGFDNENFVSVKDNTVKVIDTNTDEVIATITTGDNPNSLQRDKDGNIWVTSSGATEYDEDYNIDEEKSTKGSISKINSSNTEVLRLTVENFTFSNASNLCISNDGTTLYYNYDDAVYKLSTIATSLPTSAFKSKGYYGLSIDPFNGNIIGCEAPSFSSAGNIDVYDEAGTLLKTKAVGIAPNGCAFK